MSTTTEQQGATAQGSQDPALQAGPTPPPEQPLGKLRRSMWGRRFLLLLPVAVVVAALIGLLGVHARTVSAEGNVYELSVRYAGTARPGITVPLQIEVTKAGGFTEDVTIELSSHYLEALQVGATFPEPAESTADDEAVQLTFARPEGDTLQVSFQVEVDPAADPGRREGSVSVLESDDPVVTAELRTWVLP